MNIKNNSLRIDAKSSVGVELLNEHGAPDVLFVCEVQFRTEGPKMKQASIPEEQWATLKAAAL